MEQQIQLLKDMLSGTVPVTADNIFKAYNEEILVGHAVENQRNQAYNLVVALETEREHYEKLVKSRESDLARLREVKEEPEEPDFSDQPPKEPNLSPIFSVISDLSQGYLTKLGLGPTQETLTILNNLVLVTLKNEQLVVNENSQIVKYLINENLLRSQPAGQDRVRIRIF